MKALIPSHREKKRYLKIRGKNLRKNVKKAILEFIGVKGLADACLNWIEEKGNSAIISINRKSINSVRASLCVFPEKIVVDKVSGTLKGLEK